MEIYNSLTDSWEIIEHDDLGFPITDERLSQQEILSNDLADGIRKDTVDDLECKEKKAQAGDPPFALSVYFDCSSGEWIIVDEFNNKNIYSSEEQEWPSWTQAENKRWYAPIDPPEGFFTQDMSVIQQRYEWDEINQEWIELPFDDRTISDDPTISYTQLLKLGTGPETYEVIQVAKADNILAKYDQGLDAWVGYSPQEIFDLKLSKINHTNNQIIPLVEYPEA